MGAAVFYLLMPQKYIGSKEIILIKKNISCIWEIFQKISKLVTLKKIGLNGYVH